MKFVTLVFKVSCWFAAANLFFAGIKLVDVSGQIHEALAFLFLSFVAALLPSVAVLEQAKPRQDRID